MPTLCQQQPSVKLLCLRPLCCPLCEVIVSASFVLPFAVKLLCLRPLCCPLCALIVSASFVLPFV